MYNSLLAKNLMKVMLPNEVYNKDNLITFVSAVKNTSIDLYDDMLDYLETCDYKFSLEEIDNVWRNETNNHNTIKTLMWYVYKNSKILYYDIIINTYATILFNENITYEEIAEIYDEVFHHKYCCTLILNDADTNTTSTRWYEFTGHQWVWMNVSGSHSCYNKLISTLKNLIERAIRISSKHDVMNKLSPEERNRISLNLTRICNELRNKMHVKKYIDLFEQSGRKIKHNNFYNELDKDRNIIAFKNGVYDLQQNRLILSDIAPDDKITIFCDYDYSEYDNSEIFEYMIHNYKIIY